MSISTTTSNKGTVTAQEIIEIAEVELGKYGQTNFQVAPICKKLNISPGVVNYHFNGRDELIVRAALSSYSKYVDLAWEQAMKCNPDPELALRAWVNSQITWASENPGVAALINFPSTTGHVSELINSNMSKQFQLKGIQSLVNLSTLIRNAKNNTWNEEKINPEEVYRDQKLMLIIAKYGWTVLGISTWMSGRHLPSSQIVGTKELVPVALDYVLRDLYKEIKELN